ncbi:MAG TPA: alpha/beta fold hydrolase [Anaerolineaceae bacterium]|nr:alpha/beta fold hydrolase [Anaerolineaceae bacterium]
MDDTWVDRTAYPFAPHYLDVDGGRMHYVDEGQGRPVVMVHGTPTWSFLYRRLIQDLAGDFRVIAPDHIGFGRSDKPRLWFYRPQFHARNLAALIDHLGLADLTLVVHDFGGPIGLAYALDHPENVRSLVIFNTFLWSLKGDRAFETPNLLFNNPLGRWLYLRGNFSAQVIVRSAWGRHRPLTPAVHQQYTRALPDPLARAGTWGFMQSLLGESEWYEQLWARRERIAGKPALILWGMRDFAFKEKELARWQELFPQARVVRYPEVGHFVPDEAGEEAAAEVKAFLSAA